MSVTRTYTCGQENIVRRLDDHTGPWIDVSVPIVSGRFVTWRDVKASNYNPDKVGVVGDILDNLLIKDPIGGIPGAGNNTKSYGIMISHNAGATWFQPGGNWKEVFISGGWQEILWVDDNIVWAVASDNAYVALSTDGGLTFNLTPQRPIDSTYNFKYAAAIYALDDKIAVVTVNERNQRINDKILVFKTIDGGSTWRVLNGGEPITTGGGTIAGFAHSIRISQDQQTIVVGTSYKQWVTTNGGFSENDFNNVADEFLRSGLHLTSYPSFVDSDIEKYWHVGGVSVNFNESTDPANSWTTLREEEAIRIIGAHFYSLNNGYYVVGGKTYHTTDGGQTGILSEEIPYEKPGFTAVWTSKAPSFVCLTSCLDESVVVRFDNPTIMTQYIGQIVQLSFDGYNDTCWEVGLCSPTGIDIFEIEVVPEPEDGSFDIFTECEECLPPPLICYDLISCDCTCDDILNVSDIPFLPTQLPIVPGSLWYINGDTSFIFNIYEKRQSIFVNLQSESLSDPLGDFQNGLNDITLSITSILYNNIEQVTTPFEYVLTPANYQVVEALDLTTTVVSPNTTENCVDNTQIFFNDVFTSLNLPLTAFSDDPSNCSYDCNTECSEMFRIHYRNGDSFLITFSITDNSGTIIQYLDVNLSNITTQVFDVEGTPSTIELCNNTIFCDPVPSGITSIDFWDGECPVVVTNPPSVEPELGEACEIKPRIGEPGFSFKNCDPKEVIKVKNTFADSVYALYKRLRYGIETCCEFDLDKIDIKNSLLDLGTLYDPDICVDNTPIPDPCAPEEVVEEEVPLWGPVIPPNCSLYTFRVLKPGFEDPPLIWSLQVTLCDGTVINENGLSTSAGPNILFEDYCVDLDQPVTLDNIFIDSGPEPCE